MPQTTEFAITADDIVIVNTIVVVLMSKIAIVNISHQHLYHLHHNHGKGVHSKCAVGHGEERKEDC